MILLKLSNIPVGMSHQEYEWTLNSDESPKHNENVLIKARFDVNNLHKSQFDFNGYIEYSLNLICDRCNEKYIKRFKEDIHFLLKKNSEIEDIDIIPFFADTVDISDYIRDNIITSIPLKKLCNENCEGLCPFCGTNLNRNKCECNK